MTIKLQSSLLALTAVLLLQGCNDSGGSTTTETDDVDDTAHNDTPPDNDDSNNGESETDSETEDSEPTQSILFVANVPGYGSEFWISVDSTEDYLYPIDLFSGNGGGVTTSVQPVELAPNIYLFSGRESNDIGTELYRTDGTVAGTYLVKDIYTDNNSSPNNLTQLAENTVVFTARNTGGDTERSLWVTDGTEAGTQVLREDIDAKFLTPLGNGKAVFSGLFEPDPDKPGFLFHGLMVTDGTDSGTEVIYSSRTSPQELYSLNDGRAIFYFQDAENNNWGPWITDGTTEGTYKIKNIREDYNREALQPQFTKISETTILFSAQTPDEGIELWKTDGTEDGTVLVKDINPGEDSSGPFRITAIGNGKAIFRADDGVHGQEPWITDGTNEGTFLLKDIREGSSGSSLERLTVAENLVYFVANDNIHGRELWVTDGTTENTRLVKDLAPGTDGSGSTRNSGPVPHFVLPDGRLLFSGNDRSGSGYALWVTDGTDTGTALFYILENEGTGGSVSFPGNIFLPITVER